MTDAPPEGHFDGRLHRFAVRVYFEDTDLSGIVYHANYLRFMERARSDMLRLAGVDQRAAWEAGEGTYAVHDLSIRYHRPARLDDSLVVHSRLTRVTAASCTILQDVMRGGERLTEGRVVAAFLGADGRPRRQPAAWRARFQQLLSEDVARGD